MIKSQVQCAIDTTGTTGKEPKEAEVSRFFKDSLGSKGFFKNVNLAAKAQRELAMTTVYVFLPCVVKTCATPTLEDLRKTNKARYIFSTGTEFGSLLDLVLGRHGTKFPMDASDASRVWKAGVGGLRGRTRGSSLAVQ